jgi:hypothetical protein
MIKDKTTAVVMTALVFYVIGALCGFLVGKGMYDRPVDESVSRDTVILHDTVPDIAPEPKDSVRTRWVTRWLPAKPDTVSRNGEIFREFPQISASFSATDTVEVQVPITSKHYGSKDYDAWVSGYEPSLDSIKVYKETQYITETITRTIKDNKHFFLDVGAGCEYMFNDKTAAPFAELGARLKLGKVGIGAYGGYSHDFSENKASPYARLKCTYDIIGF